MLVLYLKRRKISFINKFLILRAVLSNLKSFTTKNKGTSASKEEKRPARILQDKYVLLLGIPVVSLVMYLLFGKFIGVFFSSSVFRMLLHNVLMTFLIWMGVRQIVIVLWKKFPWEKHPFKHLFWEIGLVAFYVMLISSLSYWFLIIAQPVDQGFEVSATVSLGITLIVTYLITSVHEAWFFYTQWNISLYKAKNLEKENLQSQYETLKSQINPHFLFNTLNTITNLIEEEPEVAVRYVSKTADFLRTILSLKDKEVIRVEEEIHLIKDFYDLQMQRFGDNLKLLIDVKKENLSKKIPPLALQMLFENAIKHNIISIEKPLIITIKDHGLDYLEIRNNLQKKTVFAQSNGIGLNNIENRYGFLSDKRIEIIQNEAFFSVRLPLLEVM